MPEIPFRWPKQGDKAFGPPVPKSDPTRPEAFVIPSGPAYAIGFKRAADMVIEAAQGDLPNPDNLFFPTAYLYRHYLELTLKDLVRMGVRLGGLAECDVCLRRHNLLKLWPKAKRLIREAWPGSRGDDLNAVEQVILEFHKLDPSGEAFRYAFGNDGRPHLEGAPGRVDLLTLKDTMDAVALFLESAEAGIDACDPGPA